MHITPDMIPSLVIAVLFCLFMLASIGVGGEHRRQARRRQARWDISILDDRDSDRPTVAMKKRRD